MRLTQDQAAENHRTDDGGEPRPCPREPTGEVKAERPAPQRGRRSPGKGGGSACPTENPHQDVQKGGPLVRKPGSSARGTASRPQRCHGGGRQALHCSGDARLDPAPKCSAWIQTWKKYIYETYLGKIGEVEHELLVRCYRRVRVLPGFDRLGAAFLDGGTIGTLGWVPPCPVNRGMFDSSQASAR